jgi:cystinosin
MEMIGLIFSAAYILFGFLYEPSYNSTGEINVWSVGFSVTSVFICSIQIIVLLYYPRFTNFVKPVWMFLSVSAILAVPIFTAIKPEPQNIVAFMGLIRVYNNAIKFMPQLYLNWLRRSTDGWSIEGVYVDLAAAILYLIRIIVDLTERQKFDQFSTSIRSQVLIISQILIGCDLIFIFQHFVSLRDARLYSPKQSVYEIDPALLNAGLDSGRTTNNKGNQDQQFHDNRNSE